MKGTLKLESNGEEECHRKEHGRRKTLLVPATQASILRFSGIALRSSPLSFFPDDPSNPWARLPLRRMSSGGVHSTP